MTLLLPPAVRATLETENASAQAKSLDKALRAYDPNLSLVWINSNIPPWELPENAIPGRFHVRNRTPGVDDTFTPITQPDGSYRGPDSGVLEEMRRRDLRRRGAVDELIANSPSRRKPDLLRDEQRRDELLADFKTAKRVVGEGGLRKRKWGRGGLKGLVGT